MATDYPTIIRDGLWSNNAVFAQMLALCPVLAVTSTATNGLGMGMATTAVLIVSNLTIATVRNVIAPDVRIPVFILLIASIVTVVDMAMNAWLHELYKVLGLFISLIVTNCVILGRAEAFASRNPPLAATLDGLMMGLGFTWALLLIGGLREVLGSGTLFAGASLLLGDSMAFLETVVIPDYKGFLLLILPPGGFWVLGFLLAGRRLVQARLDRKVPQEQRLPVIQPAS